MTNYDHESLAIDAQLDDLLKRIQFGYSGTEPWLFIGGVRGLEGLSDYERTLVHAFTVGYNHGVADARLHAGAGGEIQVDVIGPIPE